MNLGHSALLIDKGNKLGNVAVRQGLAIYILNYTLFIQRIALHELLAYCIGQLALKAVAYETASQCRTAAFIAQDITQ